MEVRRSPEIRRSLEIRDERASALMLAPAGILILMLLAAISADSALAFMGQRELQNQAAAAANDAVTQAIDNSANGGLQAGVDARPDATVAAQIVNAAVMHPYSGGLTVSDVQTSVNGTTVTVTAQGRVHYIFAGAIPGAEHYANINVRASAQLQFGN